MSSTPRVTAKAGNKPLFQKPEEASETVKGPNDVSDPDNFRVEDSQETLSASDDVAEDEDTDDAREAALEVYRQQLDRLEIDHGDVAARVDALELIVIGLCDTVLGKGVMPTIPTPDEGVTR